MSTDIAMGEAFDSAVNDLDTLINRRFAGQRSIRVEPCPDGRFCAMTSEDRLVFPPCPHLDTVERFVRAFAEKEAVRVDEGSVSVAWSQVQVLNGFSVRVPDNVVPIGGR